MNPAALPDHRFLPAPLWLLTALHALTLLLHFLAMNTLLGGIVVVLFGKVADRWNRPAVRRLVTLFPVLMAATVSLGVAPLLFLQLVYGKVVYSASITSAWFWLLIPFVAMGAYYLLYVASHRPPGDPSARRWLLLALLGLLLVSFVYSSTLSLAERPEDYKALYAKDASGLVVNPDVVAWVPRWLHSLAGAVVVGAFAVLLLARDDDALKAAAQRVLRWALVAAFLLGLAYLLLLGDHLRPLMRSPGIVWLTAGILLALAAVPLILTGRLAGAGAALLGALVGMVMTRHELRLVVLGDAFDPAAIPVRVQWDVFALFVVSLLVAVGVIAWMLRVWFRREGAARG